MSTLEAASGTDAFRQEQLALFRASVLKQAKWLELSRAVGDPSGLTALDLGSDNGVISWLFRRRGGRWHSADLTPETVDSIRRMVGEDVHLLSDGRLPFPDRSFDRIVVVDLLEHLEDDRRLLEEIARCLRPGGFAVLNVPHRKRWGVLPPIRNALGLTDAWHGHRRSGYDRRSLEQIAPPSLRLTAAHTYSRFFSHALDTALNFAYLRSSGEGARSSAKGMVVEHGDVDAGRLRALRRVYPILRTFAALDRLIPWTSGYMLLARFDKRGAARDA